MKEKIQKKPGLWLGIACYGGALLLLLLLHFGSFIYNRILYSNGTLVREELSVADFSLYELAEEGDLLVSYGGDPQLILQDAQRRVDTLYLEISYSENPRVVTAFYAAPGEGYSVRRMVYGKEESGGYRFYLPAGGGQSLRIDPASVPYNVMDTGKIIINEPRPFYAFFIFSPGEWAALCLLPGLFACFVSLVWRGKKGFAARKAGDGA